MTLGYMAEYGSSEVEGERVIWLSKKISNIKYLKMYFD